MRFVLLSLAILAAGCNGPLTKPMIDRLDENSQAKIDEVWENMVAPPNQLDRTLLLDVILSAQLYQHGVDSMRFVSEKTVGDGLVVMEIRFDREDPLFDEFSVSYIDRRGRELRRERYSRDDIDKEINLLFDEAVHVSPAESDSESELTEELKQRQAERMERMEAIQSVLEPMKRSDVGETE
ncbi:MAG: hypothetical protein H6818_17405 [Phycisphaerales bacterium]|nr:hypothetical protein [Phycisphaerales bacterium]MCB9864594.1 hypothetical protein [Phycisphaerales bacterium]